MYMLRTEINEELSLQVYGGQSGARGTLDVLRALRVVFRTPALFCYVIKLPISTIIYREWYAIVLQMFPM